METRKPLTAAMLSVAIATGSVGAGLLSAPTAEAACGSFFGMTVGDSSQCSSTFGGVAIALGDSSTAYAGNLGPLFPSLASIPAFGSIAIAAGTSNVSAAGWFSLAAATGTDSLVGAVGIGTLALGSGDNNRTSTIGVLTSAISSGEGNPSDTKAISAGVLAAATAHGDGSQAQAGYFASTATAIGNNSQANTAGVLSNSLALGNKAEAQVGDPLTGLVSLSNAVAVFNDTVAKANGDFILAINKIKPAEVTSTAPAAVTTQSAFNAGDHTPIENSAVSTGPQDGHDEDPVTKHRVKVDERIKNAKAQEKVDKVRDRVKEKVNKVRDKRDNQKKDRDKADGARK